MRTLRKKLSAGLPKLRFICPEEHFGRGKIEENTSIKFFGLGAIIFQQRFQNCILRIQSNILVGNIFLIHNFFPKFQKNSDFGRKFFCRVVKIASNVYIGTLFRVSKKRTCSLRINKSTY